MDLAIDQKFGNILDDVLWRRLIMARKVTGVHAAPPCETYTLARWIEVNDGPAPRPLRDMQSPWGKDDLTIQEVTQCFVGTLLMMKALSLMVLAYCYGASFSLEHPKGVEGREGTLDDLGFSNDPNNFCWQQMSKELISFKVR